MLFLLDPTDKAKIKWEIDVKEAEPNALELLASYLTPVLCGCAYWSRSPDNDDDDDETFGVLQYLILDTKTGELLHHGTGGLDWDIVHEQGYMKVRPIFAVAKGPYLCLSHDMGTMEILVIKVEVDASNHQRVRVRRFELPTSTFFPHLGVSQGGSKFWMHDREFDGEVGDGEPHRYHYFYKLNRVSNLFGIVQDNILMGTFVHDRTNFDPDDDYGIGNNDLKLLSDATAFCVDLDKALNMYSPTNAEAAVWTPLEDKDKTYVGQKYFGKRNSHWPYYSSDREKGKVTLMGLLEKPWFPRYTMRVCFYHRSFDGSVAIPPGAVNFIR